MPKPATNALPSRGDSSTICGIDWGHFLDRAPLSAPTSAWSSVADGKTVLVTGAAGSIGSAVSLLLMRSHASKLVLLDRSEQNMRELYRQYKAQLPMAPSVELVHADILARQKLTKTFSEHRPDVVFHAAALKHLPELEFDPFAALENNVAGTIEVLQVASSFSTQCFVNVSTDKAVNPTSILGVSKRLTELLLMTIQSHSPRRISLRLGNVLGSSGSVVPLLIQSLKKRQPLQLTDPLASRYFLTTEEAAGMVMQSSLFSKNLLLLPEMGRPHTIVELAKFLMSELGPEDDNLQVVITGLKDGEKRIEEITHSFESLRESGVPGLYEVCSNSIFDPEGFSAILYRLLELVAERTNHGLVDCLLNLVPEFSPSSTLLRCLDC